jgi:hypothetical protein
VAGRIASTNARGSGNEVVTNAMLLTGTPSFDVTLPFDTVVEDGDRLKLVRTGDEFEVKPGSYPATSLTALRITVQRIGAP